MAATPEIRAKIRLDGAEKVQAGLARVAQGASRMSTAVGGALSGIRSAAAATASAVTSIAKQAAVAGAAVGGIYLAYARVSTQIEAQIEEIGTLAQAYGVGVDWMSRFASSVRRAGGEGDTAARAIGNLGSAITGVASGDAGATELFRGLGVEAIDATGRMRKVEDVLEDVADTLARSQDSALKSAYATRLFGEQGARALLPLLNQGRAGLRASAAAADEFGVAVGPEAAANARRSATAWRNVLETVRGVGQRIVTALLPASIATMEAIDQFLRRHSKGLVDFVLRLYRSFDHLVRDIVRVATGAPLVKIRSSWVREIAAAVLTIRRIVGEGWAALMRVDFLRAPWVTQLKQDVLPLLLYAAALSGSIIRAVTGRGPVAGFWWVSAIVYGLKLALQVAEALAMRIDSKDIGDTWVRKIVDGVRSAWQWLGDAYATALRIGPVLGSIGAEAVAYGAARLAQWIREAYDGALALGRYLGGEFAALDPFPWLKWAVATIKDIYTDIVDMMSVLGGTGTSKQQSDYPILAALRSIGEVVLRVIGLVREAATAIAEAFGSDVVTLIAVLWIGRFFGIFRTIFGLLRILATNVRQIYFGFLALVSAVGGAELVSAIADAFSGLWKGILGGWEAMLDAMGRGLKGFLDLVVAPFMGNTAAELAARASQSSFEIHGRKPGAPGFATGGIVRGPGGPTSDSVIARLSNGEGVLTARAVAHYGPGIVHALNSLAAPRLAFAAGGVVEGGGAVYSPPPGASSSGGRPIVLQLDGQSYGVTASDDVAGRLVRILRGGSRASTGIQPRWMGGAR